MLGSQRLSPPDTMRGVPAPGLPAGFDRRFSRRYALVNDVRLHYVTGGPDDGEMVILLHGWPQTWYTWRHVMPALAEEGYRVVAVDYRGAVESDKPLGGYDKASMAGDIRALVRHLGATRINLVGRDIGVMVAYAYAAQWPAEILKLAMLDVPVPGTRIWDEAKARSDPQIWHFGLHQQRDIGEMLIAGREHAYILDFYKKRTHVAVGRRYRRLCGCLCRAGRATRGVRTLSRILAGRGAVQGVHEAQAPDAGARACRRQEQWRQGVRHGERTGAGRSRSGCAGHGSLAAGRKSGLPDAAVDRFLHGSRPRPLRPTAVTRRALSGHRTHAYVALRGVWRVTPSHRVASRAHSGRLDPAASPRHSMNLRPMTR
ncbi:alpha/beta fold hydrolase [Burkholderia sp. AU28863]|uniref:alpha/beta fold hydrolase n=1 Tax=Burkholderia sp. AU28863 TaxID=2015352 RepID=UPI00211AF5E2|nr:alpha/beta hydrolase [Burkholderia sp. AU28863]